MESLSMPGLTSSWNMHLFYLAKAMDKKFMIALQPQLMLMCGIIQNHIHAKFTFAGSVSILILVKGVFRSWVWLTAISMCNSTPG